MDKAEAADYLNVIADWIVQHSSSKMLSIVLQFTSAFLEFCGLKVPFAVEVQDTQVAETLHKNLLSGSFVSCMLSLLNSIMQSNIEKYAKMFLTLLKISSMIMPLPSVASSFRRKGALKQLITFMKTLIKQETHTEQNLQIISLMSIIIAKLAAKHEKCRDYLVRKGCVQAFLSSLSPKGKFGRCEDLIASFMYALGSIGVSSDQQLMIWVGGGVILGEAYLNSDSEVLHESASFLLWKISIDNEEVQDELMQHQLYSTCLRLMEGMPSVELSTTLLAILRRLSSSYKQELAGTVLPVMLKSLQKYANTSCVYTLKEITACIGSISTIPEISQSIADRGGVELIIEVGAKNFEISKLLKTCVGALVNLSLIERNRERIANNYNFYQLCGHSLEKYLGSAYVTDYILRLLINALSHHNCLYHFSTPAIIEKAIEVLVRWINDEQLVQYSLRILRHLVSHEKGFEVMRELIVGSEASFLTKVLNAMSQQVGSVNVIVEGVLLLSLIVDRSEAFLEAMKADTQLGSVLKNCLEHYGNDSEKSSMITESIANLPVEELNLILL